LPWIAFPCDLNSDEYIELVNHPHGAVHLSGWVAIVMVAAKCWKDDGTPVEKRQKGLPYGKRDGVLLRGNGKPHDAVSLALLTRLPEKLFVDLLPRLVELGMLVADLPSDLPATSVLEEEEETESEKIEIETVESEKISEAESEKIKTKTGSPAKFPADISAQTPGETEEELERDWRNEPDPEVRKVKRKKYQQARAKRKG
jgi:hypothetical protein